MDGRHFITKNRTLFAANSRRKSVEKQRFRLMAFVAEIKTELIYQVMSASDYSHVAGLPRR